MNAQYNTFVIIPVESGLWAIKNKDTGKVGVKRFAEAKDAGQALAAYFDKQPKVESTPVKYPRYKTVSSGGVKVEPASNARPERKYTAQEIEAATPPAVEDAHQEIAEKLVANYDAKALDGIIEGLRQLRVAPEPSVAAGATPLDGAAHAVRNAYEKVSADLADPSTSEEERTLLMPQAEKLRNALDTMGDVLPARAKAALAKENADQPIEVEAVA